VREAKRLAEPQVGKRLKLRDDAIAKGVPAKSLPDVFSWMLEMAKGREMSFAETQLSLSMRGIVAICDNPEIQQPLREEMITVSKTEGWAKTSLSKMRALDSFIKECMRHQQMASCECSRGMIFVEMLTYASANDASRRQTCRAV
jgi:hypothetical protein